MKISTKGRYALRVMLDLAIHNTGEYIPLKEVSQRQNITVKYLEQIIPHLKKMGYLRSTRGNSGGYRLAREPREYVIGDILRAMEGSLAPVSCLEDEKNSCEMINACPTLNFWKGLEKVISDYVDRVTLQDLLDQHHSLMGNDYSI